MAVVQISKIQVRRGQKNSNSGVPQLSSAEFAWAVDSQELFIGNGSVLEGAPYVGNTKILTEHDNILDLASSYQFAYNNPAIGLSIPRSLQSKIDEIEVSVVDFGAIGDASTNCATLFETAFTELFRNTDTTFRKVLKIPNGEYLFTSDLVVPSNVILEGETRTGVVLNIGANNIRFITSNGQELVDFDSTNRPTNINFSNFTIQRTTGQLTLSGVANSNFNKITVNGGYTLNDAITLATEPSALFWENDRFGILTDNLVFTDCLFEGNGIAVGCLQSQVLDTVIRFDNCDFFVADTAVYINGVARQGNKWQFNHCRFEEVANQALRSLQGRYTILQNCKFKNIANGDSLNPSPIDNMVYFGEQVGNVLVNCTSDRQQAAGITTLETTAAYSEVYNASKVSFVDSIYSPITTSQGFAPLAVFSAFNKFTEIKYCLTLGNHTRYGTLTLTVGADLAGTELDDPERLNLSGDSTDVAITDSYSYSPRYITTDEGTLMTNFRFNAVLKDNDSDSGIETILLSYKNPSATDGFISFDVTYGV